MYLFSSQENMSGKGWYYNQYISFSMREPVLMSRNSLHSVI